MTRNFWRSLTAGGLVAVGLFSAAPSQAGVFNLYHFVSPDQFAVGVEPELILSHGAGLGANLKFTYGLTDLNNVTAIIGTGGGPKNFRVGGNFTFDFFPDIDGQPGIGLATQAVYYRIPVNTGQLEITVIPYIHKTFQSASGEFEPFVALPFGWDFANSQYTAISTIAFGSQFRGSEHIRYSMEIGVSINNAESYFSGGVTYYH